MPMYGSTQPFLSHQGSYAPMTRSMYPHSQSSFEDFYMPGMMGSTPAYNGGFYQDALGQLQPLSSQTAPAAPAVDSMHPESQHMVQVSHACLFCSPLGFFNAMPFGK